MSASADNMREDFVKLYVTGTSNSNNASQQPGSITDISILNLGTTGAGKTMLLNGFANVYNFDTLQNALDAKKVKCLIATNVKICQKIEIKVPGEDRSTFLVHKDKGHSVPTMPRAQRFNLGNFRLHWIDTPGVLDTGGPEKDAHNIKMIMNYVKIMFPQIVAVFIVMEPGLTRLNQFETGFKQLLQCLPKDARHNIYFVFTRSRPFNFFWERMPTANLLRDFLADLRTTKGFDYDIALDDQHVLCVDNEFVSYLFAMKLGSPEQRENITKWFDRSDMDKCFERTRENIFRLLEHIFDTKHAHNTMGTYSLFKAKQLVQAMLQSLPTIISAIERSKSTLNISIKEYAEVKLDSELLQKELKIPKIIVETIQFEKARLVCKNCNVRHEKDSNGDYHTVYGQICCRDCSAWGKWFCNAIAPLGGCRVCTEKCTMGQHEYMEFEHRIVTKSRNARDRSDEVASKLMSVEELKAEKEARIKILNENYAEQEGELNVFIESAAKCSLFQQRESLMADEDFFFEAIQQMIRETQKLAKYSKKEHQKAEGLEKTKADYEKELFVLRGKATPVTSEDISQIHATLKGLKHFGKTLDNIISLELQSAQKHLDMTEHDADVSPSPGAYQKLKAMGIKFVKILGKEALGIVGLQKGNLTLPSSK